MKTKVINDFKLEIAEISMPNEEKILSYDFYTNNGHLIGNFNDASYLIINNSIDYFECLPNANVCTVGFSSKQETWYGWSHRGLWGFRIGSEVRKGDVAYTEERGEWVAKTLDDAHQMAIDYARGIS